MKRSPSSVKSGRNKEKVQQVGREVEDKRESDDEGKLPQDTQL